MNSLAYREYLDDAADAYPFDNDGDRDAVNRFLDWLEHEYQPTPGRLHGTTPEPDWKTLAREAGIQPTLIERNPGMMAD